jgi:hypothetical protein
MTRIETLPTEMQKLIADADGPLSPAEIEAQKAVVGQQIGRAASLVDHMLPPKDSQDKSSSTPQEISVASEWVTVLSSPDETVQVRLASVVSGQAVARTKGKEFDGRFASCWLDIKSEIIEDGHEEIHIDEGGVLFTDRGEILSMLADGEYVPIEPGTRDWDDFDDVLGRIQATIPGAEEA